MKPKKTTAELEKLIRQAAREIGPWPAEYGDRHQYPLGDTWRIMVSYSDASQTPFRDRLMDLGRQLSDEYDLDGSSSRR